MQGWFTPLKISDLTSNGPSGKSALVDIMLRWPFFAYRNFSRIVTYVKIVSCFSIECGKHEPAYASYILLTVIEHHH